MTKDEHLHIAVKGWAVPAVMFAIHGCSTPFLIKAEPEQPERGDRKISLFHAPT
jgi:hypothetical protein